MINHHLLDGASIRIRISRHNDEVWSNQFKTNHLNADRSQIDLSDERVCSLQWGRHSSHTSLVHYPIEMMMSPSSQSCQQSRAEKLTRYQGETKWGISSVRQYYLPTRWLRQRLTHHPPNINIVVANITLHYKSHIYYSRDRETCLESWKGNE